MNIQEIISPYLAIVQPGKIRSIVTTQSSIATIQKSVYNVLVASVITVLISLFQNILIRTQLEQEIAHATGAQKIIFQQQFTALQQATSVPFVLFAVLIVVVSFYISQAILYGIVKLLGSKQSFQKQAYFISMSNLVITTISGGLVFLLFALGLNANSLIGSVLFVVQIGVMAYTIYLLYHLIQVIHELSMVKTIVALLIITGLSIAILTIFSSGLTQVGG